MVARSYARHVTLESRPMLEKVESKSISKTAGKKTSWEVHLGMGQLLISWAIISGIMVAVFLFGFSSGRRDGLEKVLLSRSTSDVRLPILGAEPPSATPKKYNSIAQNDVATINTSPSVVEPAAPQAEASKVEDAVVVDPPTVVVGYSARPAAVAIADARGAVAPAVKGKAAVENKLVAASSGKAASAGWYVQVASTRDLKSSNALRVKAENQGVSVAVEKATLRGVSFYQVLVGPYAQKELAVSEMEKLKTNSIFSGRLFVKELK